MPSKVLCLADHHLLVFPCPKDIHLEFFWPWPLPGRKCFFSRLWPCSIYYNYARPVKRSCITMLLVETTNRNSMCPSLMKTQLIVDSGSLRQWHHFSLTNPLILSNSPKCWTEWFCFNSVFVLLVVPPCHFSLSDLMTHPGPAFREGGIKVKIKTKLIVLSVK